MTKNGLYTAIMLLFAARTVYYALSLMVPPPVKTSEPLIERAYKVGVNLILFTMMAWLK